MLIGSTNWYLRRLRLGFEFNVGCYDAAIARQPAAWFDECRRAADG